ncbi:MAG: purine-nucleoside phosphorylase [Gammaproteobacteria bacterium]|nr:purine-nucleoside phosphorylase [Gammaproteobacteria bacterium]
MTQHAQQAAEFIHAKVKNFSPKIGVVLGSGLGGFTEQLTDKTTIPYQELPGFPHHKGVAGHAGELVLGKLNGTPLVCLRGRAHYYEGYDNGTIQTLIRTLKLLGCESLIVTNASGSLNEGVSPGSLMTISDHLNFQFNNPLVGHNDPQFGERFVPLNDAYDHDLRQQVHRLADELNIHLHEGVYIGVLGPTYETPAEIRAYRMLGADAVGMSTIPDVIVARHCGMKVLAIAVICNYAAGMVDIAPSHQEVLENASQAAKNLQILIAGFISRIAE